MQKNRYSIDPKKYGALHKWVSYHLGSPQECSNPDCTGVSKTYQWSNISKQYKRDLSDWQRLCVPCHKSYDAKDTCRNGHEFTPENIAMNSVNKTTGRMARRCRTCRDAYEREAWQRRKLKMKEEAMK